MPNRSRNLLLLILVLALVILAVTLLVQLIEMRQLAGVVRDAETGAPLQGVTLSVGDARATSNAQGEYTIAFARGPASVTAALDGYVPVERSVNGSDPFAKAYTLDLHLTGNYVAGYVLDAETNQTLPNAALQFGARALVANAQGAFEIRMVRIGTPITATVPGYQPAATAYAGKSPLNLALAAVQVTIQVSDLAGQPIAQALVQAGDVSGTTDAQGRVVLRRVKPGVSVRATARGFDTATAPLTTADAQLKLRPNAVDGTVTDATTGKPISGTLVYLGSSIATTNAQGLYHLENLPPTATIALQAPGYRKTQMLVTGAGRQDVKLQPFQVKGIHIPFGATQEHLRTNMDLVTTTELNAIVLDVKAEKGRVAWDSQVPLAKQIQAPYLKGVPLAQVIERCRKDNIYCIARLPVFQDTLLATVRPDLALRFPNGQLYTDSNGSAWTNAANSTVWDYNIALAKEAATLGFDEIQFDYVRFPGQVTGLYTGTLTTEDGRIGAIAGFLARAQKELRPTGVFISADVFGLTTATNDDQSTGQRLRDLGPYVDYISPMVYPDVWSNAAFLLSNGLGIANCTEAVRCPYDVIYNSYKRSAEKTPTKIRLWLQAYVGRGNYGVAQYKLQKKAAEDAGSVGWTFWSGVGDYDAKIFNPK